MKPGEITRKLYRGQRKSGEHRKTYRRGARYRRKRCRSFVRGKIGYPGEYPREDRRERDNHKAAAPITEQQKPYPYAQQIPHAFGMFCGGKTRGEYQKRRKESEKRIYGIFGVKSIRHFFIKPAFLISRDMRMPSPAPSAHTAITAADMPTATHGLSPAALKKMESVSNAMQYR